MKNLKETMQNKQCNKELAKMFKNLFWVMAIMILSCGHDSVYAQGMGINTGSMAPDPSAMLDVSSNSKGVLVPRMSAFDMYNIPSPAVGLLVYLIDGIPGFYYYNGAVWTAISTTLPLGTDGQILMMLGSTPTWVTISSYGLPPSIDGQVLKSVGGVPTWVSVSSFGLPPSIDGQILKSVGGVPTWVSVAPSLTTTNITDIMAESATSGGDVTSDGGAAVIERGVCWSIYPNPDVFRVTKTTDGPGTGGYYSLITGLVRGVTYYVRAYATNSIGTAYGNEVVFTAPATIPTLTTTGFATVAGLGRGAGGGNITDDGGAPVTARGVCWSNTPGPTADLATRTTDGTGSGVFTSSIPGLTDGTTYYVRAYAINSVGTVYGDEVSFVASPIGNSQGGGVLAYLLQPGDTGFDPLVPHGLIAAPYDQTSGGDIIWDGCYTVVGASSTAIGTGQANTATIISHACYGGPTAATICASLSIGGFTDWYLPSRDELTQLYIYRDFIGGLADGFYWSSSEIDVNDVWLRAFADGTEYHANKLSSTIRVRAVRSF